MKYLVLRQVELLGWDGEEGESRHRRHRSTKANSKHKTQKQSLAV